MSLGAGGRPAVAAAVLALTAAATIRQFAQPAPADDFAPDQQVYLAMVQTPFIRIAAIGFLRRLAVSWTSATVCGTRHIAH